jgi:hypothetical protein
MTTPATDDEIRQIITDYEAACERAMEERDARLRAALNSGRKQADLVRVTEMSREAIRQALNPEIRAAIKARRQAARQSDS